VCNARLGANLVRSGWLPILTLVVAAGAAGGCTTAPAVEAAADGARESRTAALAGARVWQAPAIPVGQANLRDNPPGAQFSPDRDLECRFTVRNVGGTTPKFYCELPNGDIVKIKYGEGNPELPAEVAASRLLTALGFWSDRMFVVRAVRCLGCPPFPFKALRCLERTGVRSICLAGSSKDGEAVTFPFAVVERRLDGRVIESVEDEGWGWYELDAVDPARGGSSRAEVDALRLMAVFLAHWDNKGPNQRLVCPPGADRPDGGCERPIAIMQDLGATFGPLKLDLHNWREGRVWQDARSCAVSMEHLPWGGGTFPEARISEGGRQLLLGLLEQLTDAQLRDLFEASRVVSHSQLTAEYAHVAAWVNAFKDRVRQIREAGPCPATTP
jgi:hypothetical protein